MLPSLYVPVAVYWTVVPTFTDWPAGATVIDTSLAAVTVKLVPPVTPAELAVIWDVPCPALVARPNALTVATPLFEESQVAELVKSSVDPSE